MTESDERYRYQAPLKPELLVELARRMGPYEIVRFRFKGANTVIRSGVSLEEAQAWCERDDTRGDGWFDGYRREEG